MLYCKSNLGHEILGEHLVELESSFLVISPAAASFTELTLYLPHASFTQLQSQWMLDTGRKCANA